MKKLLTTLSIFLMLICSNVYAEVSKEILEQEKVKDIKVIAALVQNGSNISKPHTLEHHFYAHTAEIAQALAEEAKALGYEVSPIKKGNYEGEEYWYFDLIKAVVPILELVTQETTLMLTLASKYGVEYDGWGCLIVE